MSESKYIHHVTPENFTARVVEASHKAPVLVDFWAAWCGPCQMLMPLLEKLAEDYGGKFTVAKVNTDEQQQLALEHGIRSLPTVKVFRYGQEVDGFMGLQPESAIRAMIERYLEKPGDRLRVQADTALAQGDATRAVELLEQAEGMEPDNHAISMELANALLHTGALDQAEQRLQRLPLAERGSDAAKLLEARVQFAGAVADSPDAESLNQRIEDAPDDLQARYQLGARCLLAGEFAEGLEQLLEIMKRNRKFEDDLGRKSLLAAFNIVGDAELVGRYRKQMASLLF